MDLKEQMIAEYLMQGSGFRRLAAKHGISRTMINIAEKDLNICFQLPSDQEHSIKAQNH